MNIIKVRCPKKKIVETEKVERSMLVHCPPNCPFRKEFQCSNQVFRGNDVVGADEKVDVPYNTSSTVEVKVEPQTQPTITNTRVETQTPSFVAGKPKNEPKRETKRDFDPFADVTVEDALNDESIQVKPTPSPTLNNQDRLSKYNLSKTMFSSVNINLNEPCFVDGIYTFYFKSKDGMINNVNAALKHIFRHWLVSRIFTKDGKELSSDFLAILKYKNLHNQEKEISQILNSNLNLNQKFFRLFYDIIYKDENLGFYFSEKESPHSLLTPIFTDKSEFFKKISDDAQSGFLDNFKNCFEELLDYLDYYEENDFALSKQKFIDLVPIVVNDNYGKLILIVDTIEGIKVKHLGNCSDFINNLTTICSYEEMTLKYNFLSKYEITINHLLKLREDIIPTPTSGSAVSDEIVELLGIKKFTTTHCAMAYQYYLFFQKEYNAIKRPDKIYIANCWFTRLNFYQEVVDVTINACKYRFSKEYNAAPTYKQSSMAISLFFLVRDLLKNNIFADFEKTCEATNLSELKKEIIAWTDITPENYFKCKYLEPIINIDGIDMTVSEYIENILDHDIDYSVKNLINSKIYQTWVKAKHNLNFDYEEKKKEANKIIDSKLKIILDK